VKKGTTCAKGAASNNKPVLGKKRRMKDRSDQDDIDSYNSLNESMVDDNDHFQNDKKKKIRKRSPGSD
jgi:hypothetical protein